MKRIVAMIALTALLCGCAGEKNTELVPVNKTLSCSKPYILNEGSCCLDMDDNGVCDASEAETTTTLDPATSTTQTGVNATTSTTLAESCTDGIQNQNETGPDCGGPCGACKSRCEILISETGIKPAAKTVKLCLAGNTPISYGGYNFTAASEADGRVIFATDPNGTVTKGLIGEKDLFFGNVVMRLIGTAEQRGVPYTYVYSWTVAGGVRCRTNSDCGADGFAGFECFGAQKIMKKYFTHICSKPDTVLSACEIVQKQEDYVVCNSDERCATGDTRCYPKNCFNKVSDKDENGIDCGGSCYPCHCGNGVQDEDETGDDCGGSCRACEGTVAVDNVPPAIKITSPQARVYDKRSIDLIYAVNEPVSWCGFVLNGGSMISTRGNATINARPGANDVVVYCNDTSGNLNTSRRTFNVSLVQDRVCETDKVANAYDQYFDNVTFYLDTEDYLGIPDRCTQAEFSYSLSAQADGAGHARSLEGAIYMSDVNLSEHAGSSLGYDCRTTGKLSASYARLLKGLDPTGISKMKVIIYLKETGLGNDPGAFWRIYAYLKDGQTPDDASFIDVPYKPMASNCANASFQEMDLSVLLEKMQTPYVEARVGFYTSKLNAQINLLEMETYSESKKR